MGKTLRYLPMFSMVLLMLMLCDSVTVYKLVSMPFGYTTACAFVIPFWFVVCDIITEVYGSKISKRLMLTALSLEVIFSLACYCLTNLKSPTFWHDQAAFNLILGNLPRVVSSSILALLVSGYINISLIMKWKILLKGKYFWLRSIGASWIGEGFYTIVSISSMLYGMISLEGLLLTILWSYLVKITITAILAGPANFIATRLKNAEGTNKSDSILNPFKKETIKEQLS